METPRTPDVVEPTQSGPQPAVDAPSPPAALTDSGRAAITLRPGEPPRSRPASGTAAALVRCAICHGDPDATVAPCPSCQTPCHADCRAWLRRCPTIGCPLAAPAPSRLIPSRVVFAAGLALVLGLLYRFAPDTRAFQVVALLHAIVVPSYWTQRLSEARTWHKLTHFLVAAVSLATIEGALLITGYAIHDAVPDADRAASGVVLGGLLSVGLVVLPPSLAAFLGSLLHEPRPRRGGRGSASSGLWVS